jgi:hypothetical protein
MLTVGHLDPEAIRDCVAVAIRPLDARLILRLLAEFPELTVQQKDGDVVISWHGRGRVEEGEEFALRLMDATGCVAADRRNGRLFKPGSLRG